MYLHRLKGMQSSKQGKSAIFSGKYVPSSTEENENLSSDPTVRHKRVYERGTFFLKNGI